MYERANDGDITLPTLDNSKPFIRCTRSHLIYHKFMSASLTDILMR